MSNDTKDNHETVATIPDEDWGTTTPTSRTAYLPFSSSECIGQKQEDIVDALENSGFYMISVTASPELEAGELDKKETVRQITIDGKESFDAGEEFSKDADIEITYYDAKTITAPVSSEEAESADVDELVDMFKEAGFLNVELETKEDIDPEYSQDTLRIDVSIDDTKSFENTDAFPIDAKVVVTAHRPMEKYKVTIDINFIPNFFFNKYGVDIEVGYKDLGTLSHGEDGAFEVWLKPGKHTITFRKHSYKSPENEIEFTIQGETDISYEISCYEDSIHVEQTGFADQGAVGENEAMVPASAWDFKYDNYKDVEATLKNAGFTNIKTEILYDIFWGWTEEGEVDSVSIDGNTDFSKGNIFDKDVEIVITYHMKEEDDPNRPTESETTESEVTKSTETTDEKDSVSYSTNTKDTVKNGNTGVYAYKSIGHMYDIYWIIDFDEGYVYYFTEGNGNEICDRLKIVSGDLNSVVIITYHDGDSQWSYGLHFKWKNQPDHLIMQDEDGLEYDYYTTNLDSALKVRDSKTVVDY